MANPTSPAQDVMTAFSLLALDGSLQGLALWGPRSEISDQCIEELASHRSGPVVRLPAYASPADVTLVGNGIGNGIRNTPKEGRSLHPPFLLSKNMIERARHGVLLIESADLLSRPTAAALRRTLDAMPGRQRPMLIARSDAHPSTWSLLADECAFWLQEPPSTRGPGNHQEPKPEPFPFLPDDTTLAAASRRLLQFPAEGLPVESIVTSTPVPGAGPPPDQFVLRAAAGLAALDDAREIRSLHVQRALQLVVLPRLGASRPGVEPEGSRTGDPDGKKSAVRWTGGKPGSEAANKATERAPAGAVSTGEGGGAAGAISGKGIDEGTKTKYRVESDPRTTGAIDGQRSADPGAGDDDGRIRIVTPADLFAALSLEPSPAGPSHPKPLLPRGKKSSTPVRPGPPTGTVLRHRRGQPLSVAATLHAAMPWQRLRRGQMETNSPPIDRADAFPRQKGEKANWERQVLVLPDDLRSRRRRPRPKSLYILAVDGSGSMGQQRMQLAKSAALAVLTGAYRERRYVGLIDFRHFGATLLCPPGRSSAAVRRRIVSMPSGGGTPLPAGLALARDVAQRWRRQHSDGPIRLVLFTDGKANVPLALPGPEETPLTSRVRRDLVQEDLQGLACQLRPMGISVHIVDGDGGYPSPDLQRLARTLDATVLRIDRTYRRTTSRGVL